MSASAREFYVAGGTMEADAESYIVRPADEIFYQAVKDGEFCYVLTSRQMGKSSLLMRTRERLLRDGVRVAYIDLTQLGQDGNPETWYFSLASRVHQQFGLSFALVPWWQERNRLTALLRLTEFLEMVAAELAVPAAIFLDEIETAGQLHFSDDFFAGIRSCYNFRASNQSLKKLTFAFAGVTTPPQLISDPKRTPFNIGRAIELSDFTLKQAQPLADWLTGGKQALEEIMIRTDGHPYMTQMVCRRVAQGDHIAVAVNELFLSPKAQREETNLKTTGDRLKKGGRRLLLLYERVLLGDRVIDQPSNPLFAELKLTGAVKVDKEGKLQVRNRIYAEVFSPEWVQPQVGVRVNYVLWGIVATVLLAWPLYGLLDSSRYGVGFIVGLAFAVLAVPIAFRVWSRLEPGYLDAVSGWVDPRWESVLSPYRNRYRRAIYFQHRTFDVKGLSTQGAFSVELDQVFVELALSPVAPHKVLQDPLRKLINSREVRNLLDFLKSDTYGNLVILGPPGSGKTTLLKHIALSLAGPWEKRVVKLTPVLIYLRDLAVDLPGISLPEAIRRSLHNRFQPPRGWFENELNENRCLVMIDGLDELVELEKRLQAVRWIESQMIEYARTRFVVTSRPRGYVSNTLAGVTVLEVLPLSLQQVDQFVRNWYLATEILRAGKRDAGVEVEAADGAQDLLKRLGASSALTDLAVNPLLLTMIATVHKERNSLPGRRVELYNEIFDVFLGKRRASKGLSLSLTPAQKRRVLEPLAWHMMQMNLRRVSRSEAEQQISGAMHLISPDETPNSFLAAVRDDSGLLVEVESGEFSFAHGVFQEFLAATYVRAKGLEPQLTSHVNDPWWAETIRLYAAQADATRIVEACLKDPEPSVQALNLAEDCIEEALEISPAMRARVREVLMARLKTAENS